jgi:predicted O-methyltransferase YrrM
VSEAILERILKQLEVARSIPSTPIRLRQRAVEASVEYIANNPRFDNVQVTMKNRATLQLGLQAATMPGSVAEFGVFQGNSLTLVARHFNDRTVHGFDSFVGLPQQWGGTDKGTGAFDVGGRPPTLPVTNVEFHVGFFDETVPPFASAAHRPFAFVHLDADLYSSTKLVFDHLAAMFVPGTIVVFDEYFGYHGWHLHEHRAFMEFLEVSGLDYVALAIGHMNLAVRLTASR